MTLFSILNRCPDFDIYGMLPEGLDFGFQE